MRITKIDTKATYTLVYEGKLHMVRDVPARVCLETGEEFFSPETVERIQTLIKNGKRPKGVLGTSAYEFG